LGARGIIHASDDRRVTAWALLGVAANLHAPRFEIAGSAIPKAATASRTTDGMAAITLGDSPADADGNNQHEWCADDGDQGEQYSGANRDLVNEFYRGESKCKWSATEEHNHRSDLSGPHKISADLLPVNRFMHG
jgi:hypothetical protein